MNLPAKIKCLEETLLIPRVTLSLTTKNLRSGKASGKKSVSFSAQFTILRMLLCLMGVCLIMKGVLCLMKMKVRSQARRHYKEKLKKMKKGWQNRKLYKKN